MAVLAAVDACTTMLRGGIWNSQEPCTLNFDLDAREFGGVISVTELSRSAYFRYRPSGAALVECEFSALYEAKGSLKNAILAVDAQVSVEGCDAYRFAPIGYVEAELSNVTITGNVVVRGLNSAATMMFSRFVDTFEDADSITECGSSLRYEVYTAEGNPAQLGKVYNSAQGDLPISSFSIVNEPSEKMSVKELTLLGKTYRFNVSTSVQGDSNLIYRYYLVPLRLYLNRISYMRTNCADHDVGGDTVMVCAD